MRMLRRQAGLAVLIVALSATCGSPTRTVWSEAIRAAAHADRVEITNLGERRVFSLVLGQEAAALVNWAPCVTAPDCGMIEPGTTRTVTHANALVDTEERFVMVYWWVATTALNGELRPGPVKGMTLAIPGR